MNVHEYRIVQVPAAGLALIRHPAYGRQLWSVVKLRKHRRSACVLCGLPVGDEGYRPVTNAGNRYERICLRHRFTVEFPPPVDGEPT